MLVDAGAAWALGKMFGTGSDVTIGLYTNKVTIADGLTVASMTAASGGGYATKTLSGGSWTVADNGSGIQQASAAQQTWTLTGALDGGATIYGYYIYVGTTLIDVTEAWPAGLTPGSAGGTISVTPRFTLSKGTPT